MSSNLHSIKTSMSMNAVGDVVWGTNWVREPMTIPLKIAVLLSTANGNALVSASYEFGVNQR